MALAAQLDLEELPGRAGSKFIAAGTNYFGIWIIFGMNFIFHISYLASVNTYLPSVIAGRFEFNSAVNQSEEGIIPAYTDIIAGINECASLPN